MTRRLRTVGLLTQVVVLLWTLPALSGQPIAETRKVDKDATISIENLAGEVTVTGWDQNEVKITGTLDEKAEKLEIVGGGAELSIEVRYPDRVRNIKEGSDLAIMVPRGADVEISTVSADVSVDAVSGELEIETVSGEVRLRGKPAAVEAEAVSGSFDVDVATDSATLTCVSGDIVVRGAIGELECGVVSGSIDVAAGKDLSALECETVSGDVTVTGELPRAADWSLSAHSGDITVNLLGKVDAEFRIGTFSGEIHDVFGHQAERTSRYAPGRSLEFTEGEGSATVEIDAFSGDVQVLKK
ncbi:MAG TPA: DUF4097 family beta strand repeat-containing protein [Candidatus Krumholzibacteria bacterium]|nr:DUF4097 family beta strand repeat-containing protein [Candidatus Krumholzibacteria bacterium]HPD71019.1 DUF4097 family beta strand repeat-containing protein [Candidatus Krumholzibacteria bacterium]HRY39281.1 DUF4097 family beta strand repeat-containing protein [Candidatus Krumholzibacteria bacterium]